MLTCLYVFRLLVISQSYKIQRYSFYSLGSTTFPYFFNKKAEVFSTNEIRNTILFFIKDFTSSYDIEKEYSFDEIWDKYFEGKVPDYFRYHYISDWNIMEWNFFDLRELLKDLPNDKWLTDSYDRDWAYEHLPAFIKTFDDDL